MPSLLVHAQDLLGLVDDALAADAGLVSLVGDGLGGRLVVGLGAADDAVGCLLGLVGDRLGGGLVIGLGAAGDLVGGGLGVGLGRVGLGAADDLVGRAGDGLLGLVCRESVMALIQWVNVDLRTKRGLGGVGSHLLAGLGVEIPGRRQCTLEKGEEVMLTCAESRTC